MGEDSKNGGKTALSTLISLALHGGACVLLCISYNARIKPTEIHAMKVSVVRPEPPKPKVEPPKPKPEPPKPEPPKVEPPKQPDPPKVEPPKQKVEPPKPEPPKVVKPLPTPQPLKPKQDPPKVEPPKPKVEQPKKPSLEERIRDAKTVSTPKPPKNTPKTPSLTERLNKVRSQEAVQPTTSKTTEVASAGIVIETKNYADLVAKPYIQQHWIQPVKGEMDVANPSPVEITFTVYAGGNISNARITKRSNSRVMNNSVEQFIRGLARMAPISSIGSKAASLQITVSMVLSN